MPDDKTIDFVVAFLAIGLLALGLGSWLLGWLVRTWDRFVNRSQNVTSSDQGQTDRTDQTNGRTNERSPHDQLWQEFLLDRTRTRLIAVMVDSELTVSEIRNLLKGESAAIGIEIEAARQRLGLAPSAPYRTPVAGRPTSARFEQTDADYPYHPIEG